MSDAQAAALQLAPGAEDAADNVSGTQWLTYSGLQNIVGAEAMEFTGAIREAKKGTAELVVLSLLEDEPRHGYELAKLVEDRSAGELTFNFASLYATLYKLEERKWVQGRWVEKSGQRRRRYYKITAEGRDVLAAQRREWRRFFELIRDLAGVRYA